MTIGTLRVEEARVFDVEAGYHQFHHEDGDAYGSFEVFWHDAESDDTGPCDEDGDFDPLPSGWYWIAGFPGCMPDGDTPSGPFGRSIDARADADEFWLELPADHPDA